MKNRIFARYLGGLFSVSEQFQKFLGNSSEGLRKLSVCGGVLVGIYKNFLSPCSKSVNVCSHYNYYI